MAWSSGRQHQFYIATTSSSGKLQSSKLSNDVKDEDLIEKIQQVMQMDPWWIVKYGYVIYQGGKSRLGPLVFRKSSRREWQIDQVEQWQIN